MQVAQAVLHSTVDLPGELASRVALQPDLVRVGRKLVMGGRVDGEVEAVAEVFGQGMLIAGFYSYGEISPFTPGAECKLHNQTTTVTCLGEDELSPACFQDGELPAL